MYRTILKVQNKILSRPKDMQISLVNRASTTSDNRLRHHVKSTLRSTSKQALKYLNSVDKCFLSGLAVLTIVTIGISSAHKSPEIRDWLTLYAPWMDEVIDILYQENTTYAELLKQCLFRIKKTMTSVNPDLEQYFPDEKTITAISTEAKPIHADKKKQ